MAEERTKAVFTKTKRAFAADDPFFDLGNVEREAWAKRIAVPIAATTIDGGENERPPILCGVCGCRATFRGIGEFEDHVRASHTHVCSVCNAHMPSAKFLDIHIREIHDSYFAAMIAREKTFECIVDGCDRMFAGPKQRRLHLVDFHKFPREFSVEDVIHRGRRHYRRAHTKDSNLRQQQTAASTSAGKEETAKEGEEDEDKTMDDVSTKLEGLHVTFSHRLPDNFVLRGRGRGNKNVFARTRNPSQSSADAKTKE